MKMLLGFLKYKLAIVTSLLLVLATLAFGQDNKKKAGPKSDHSQTKANDNSNKKGNNTTVSKNKQPDKKPSTNKPNQTKADNNNTKKTIDSFRASSKDTLHVVFNSKDNEIRIECLKCDSNTRILTDVNIRDTLFVDTTDLFVRWTYAGNKITGGRKKLVHLEKSKEKEQTQWLLIVGIAALALLTALLYYIYRHHFSKRSKTLKQNDAKYLVIKKYMSEKNIDTQIPTIKKIQDLIVSLNNDIQKLITDKNSLIKTNEKLEQQIKDLNFKADSLTSEIKRLQEETSTKAEPLVAAPNIPEPPKPIIKTVYYNLPTNNVFTKEVEPNDKDAFVVIEFEENKNEGAFHLNEKKQALLLETVDYLKRFCNIENSHEIHNPQSLLPVNSGIVSRVTNGQWQIKQKADIRLA